MIRRRNGHRRSGRWATGCGAGRWPAAVRARTASPIVAPVVTMSSTTTMSPPARALLRTEREGSREVARTLARPEPGLVGGPARHPERLPDGDVGAGIPQQAGRPAGELVDDVGAAGQAASPTRRHRHEHDGSRGVTHHLDDRRREQMGQRTQQRRPALLLPGDDRQPQHAGVLTGGGDVQRAGAHHARAEGRRRPSTPRTTPCDGRPHPGHAAPSRRSTAAVARSIRPGWRSRSGPCRAGAMWTRGRRSVAGGQAGEAPVVDQAPRAVRRAVPEPTPAVERPSGPSRRRCDRPARWRRRRAAADRRRCRLRSRRCRRARRRTAGRRRHSHPGTRAGWWRPSRRSGDRPTPIDSRRGIAERRQPIVLVASHRSDVERPGRLRRVADDGVAGTVGRQGERPHGQPAEAARGEGADASSSTTRTRDEPPDGR